MTTEALTKFRVTVWQPYFAGCMLAIGQQDSNVFNVFDGDTELQREVFTCAIEEDVWAGLTDDAKRTSLSNKFIDAFQPMLAPSERDMLAFGAFVAELRDVALSPASEWSPSASAVVDVGTPPIMVNGLLALYQQLSWLLDVFRHLPGASVSVR